MDILGQLTQDKHTILKVQKLDSNAKLPTRGTEYSAGLDLYSVEDVEIKGNSNSLIHTGIAVEIPIGYVGLVFARSGLATKRHLRPSNCVGVIDSDYRGEILVSLHLDSDQNESINAGDRIAQLVIVPYLSMKPIEVETLSDTVRGYNGFGSTGTN